MGTVGLVGLMTKLATVDLGKKPWQLTARARVPRAAKAAARRSFCFVDDIVI
jgi:hypothetical protein